MDKWTVARVLDEIAQYTSLSDPQRFRSRAFERAARAIESLDEDIGPLVASGDLVKIPGIGKAVASIVKELADTGESRYLEDLRKQYPPGIFDLLRVPGLGITKIAFLYEKLGIGSLEELEAAARDGRLAKLKGFGPKTTQKILEGIERARWRESQFLLPTGLEVAERMRGRLARIEEIKDAEVVGSVRRRLEVNRNVNLAIATNDRPAVVEGLRKLVDQLEAIDERTYKGSLPSEVSVLFHLADPDDFGATVVETTGSAEFVDALKKKMRPFELREGALYKSNRHVKTRNEEEFFEKVGIPFVEPERRETGEDLAHKRRHALVEPTDLRGTFHVHTTFSDGRNTVLEMLTAAKDRGLDYVGLSDHSPAAFYAGGLSVERLAEQQAEIARREPEVAPMRVFRGTEADILPDGSIDYGDKVLSKLDFVVASVHSRFTMPKDEMTERMLKALDDPYVTILGHITGRKLLARDGYTVEYDRVFERAASRGVCIEINGNPNRLDLDWRHVGRALELGVMFVINPDAHSIAEMSHLISGTWVARKAGLTPKQILNTKSVEEVEEWLKARPISSPRR